MAVALPIPVCVGVLDIPGYSLEKIVGPAAALVEVEVSHRPKSALCCIGIAYDLAVGIE